MIGPFVFVDQSGDKLIHAFIIRAATSERGTGLRSRRWCGRCDSGALNLQRPVSRVGKTLLHSIEDEANLHSSDIMREEAVR